jgi:hypothetical protein
MGKIIGIDLGTTNSAVAYMVAGKPEVIANAEGNRTTPSVVAINKSGERLVGQVAQRQRVTNAKNTIYGVKRLIGRKFSDKEVQQDLDIMPYEIVKHGTGVGVKMGDKDYSPEEVSAMILGKIKADAEAFLGEKSPKRSLPFLRTSMTRSVRRPKTPVKSPASRLSVLLTSRPPQRLPTASTRKKKKKSPFSTLVVEHSTSRFWNLVTAYLK